MNLCILGATTGEVFAYGTAMGALSDDMGVLYPATNEFWSGFGIESSYRIHRQVQPKPRNPAIGSIFAITLLPLKNLWMLVLWSRISPVKPGPRPLERRTFQFGQLSLDAAQEGSAINIDDLADHASPQKLGIAKRSRLYWQTREETGIFSTY